MKQIGEGDLSFTFPDGWNISRPDQWSFYRNQFDKQFDEVRLACRSCESELRCAQCGKAKVLGAKAVDILAITPDGLETIAWLIEIKDYRREKRTKVIDLADEMALKVRDTLAMLVAAAKIANDAEEKASAANALKASRIRIVLHVEQVAKPSRLFPRPINPANVRQLLRKLIRFVDPHPLVVDSDGFDEVEWSVD